MSKFIITDELIEDLKELLLEVAEYLSGEKATQIGEEYYLTCHIHDDHKPSLRINTDENVYFCDVCTACGNVFNYAGDWWDLDVTEPKDFVKIVKRLKTEFLEGDQTDETDEPPPAATAKAAEVIMPTQDTPKLEFEYTRQHARSHYFHNKDGEIIYRKDIFKHIDVNGNDTGGKDARFFGCVDGGYVSGLGGAEQVIYNLHQVAEAAKLSKEIWFVEGEKDADSLGGLGLIATTSGGVGTWSKRSESFAADIKGVSCVNIIADNDTVGRKYVAEVASDLNAAGINVKYIELPGISEIETAKGKRKGVDENGADVSDWLAAGHTLEELLAIAAGAGSELPIMVCTDFLDEDVMLPEVYRGLEPAEYPIDAFPGWLQEYVLQVALATQTPVDLPGNAALAVLSAALAQKIKVRAKQDWLEQVNLYIVTLLEPSNLKSAVMSQLDFPVKSYEAIIQDKERAEVAKQRAQISLLKRKKDTLEKRLADINCNAEDRAKFQMDFEAVTIQLAALPEPVATKLLVSDCTAEKLASVLSEQRGERIAVLSAEGGIIFSLAAGRYGNSPNFDIYLSGYTGESYLVDRQGRDSLRINNPAITLGLAAQPSVIINASGKKEQAQFQGRGLYARFLFSYPKSKIGYRDVRTDYPIDPAAKSLYEENIMIMMNLPFDAQTKELVLSEGALELFVRYRENLEADLLPTGRFYCLQDWGGKAHGQLIRLCGLLHVAENIDKSFANMPISAEIMANAVKLIRYFESHALITFGAMQETPEHKLAIEILGRMNTKQLCEFSIRDVKRSFTAVTREEEITAALKVLVDLGYVIPVKNEKKLATKKYTIAESCRQVA
ncbi:MAG: DUF3987 domain-containing protein [Negativicutes bacterium]|jgi:hypothetical protein